jgi:hypothetical protein
MDPLLEVPPAQQANFCRTGCSSSVPNYRNYLLIDVVKQQRSQGLEAWRNITLLYQSTSNKVKLCDGHDIVTTE